MDGYANGGVNQWLGKPMEGQTYGGANQWRGKPMEENICFDGPSEPQYKRDAATRFELDNQIKPQQAHGYSHCASMGP